MPKGDHLIVSRGIYSHHGLDLGDGRIMQYGSHVGQTNARVEIVDRGTFSRGKPIKVMDKPAAYSPDEILARAEHRLGEQDYSLVWDNCEHFVNWCRTGEGKSRQVESVGERLISSASKLMVNHLAETLVKSGAKATTKSMTRGVTPWLLVADGAQLVTEFATAQMGAREKDAEAAGRMVGAGASAGIGALFGGPAGALVAMGLWAAGEAVGKRASSRLLRGLNKDGPTDSERKDAKQRPASAPEWRDVC
uniref:Lecithin retinol acyltransferase n=1 Tax=Candidatus Kentrum sp. TC TaxID=2126339 RepID=A0A450YLN5_9GAMM|nr:MAG: Lecithin retinol acyltransferase [Candidatus Kentron sp. TC]